MKNLKNSAKCGAVRLKKNIIRYFTNKRRNYIADWLSKVSIGLFLGVGFKVIDGFEIYLIIGAFVSIILGSFLTVKEEKK